MKRRLFYAITVIGILIFFTSFKVKKTETIFHQYFNDTIREFGYAPTAVGTQLNYKVKSNVNGEENNSVLALVVSDIHGSAVTITPQNGGKQSVVYIQQGNTIFPAIDQDTWMEMINKMKTSGGKITHSDENAKASFPNHSLSGGIVNIQNPQQFLTYKDKDVQMEEYTTFQNGRIDAIETLSTPAGVFKNCVKASYTYQIKATNSNPAGKSSSVSKAIRTFWLYPGIGSIKNTTYITTTVTGLGSGNYKTQTEAILQSIHIPGKKSGKGNNNPNNSPKNNQGNNGSASNSPFQNPNKKSNNSFTIDGGEYVGGKYFTLSDDKKNASGLLADGRITATIKDAIVNGNGRDEITIVLNFPAKSPATYSLPSNDEDNEVTIDIVHYKNSQQTNTHDFTVSQGTLKITSVDSKTASGSFDFKSTDADATGVDANYHLKGNFKVALVKL